MLHGSVLKSHGMQPNGGQPHRASIGAAVHYERHRPEQTTGILDGGATEVALGGSRLTRFIKGVESVTGGMGAGEAVEEARTNGSTEIPAGQLTLHAGDNADVEVTPSLPAPPAAPDPWPALIQLGTQLLMALGGVAAMPDNEGRPDSAHPWVARDPATGARSLHIPLPVSETLHGSAGTLSALAKSAQDRR
jgi:hypothetical protein